MKKIELGQFATVSPVETFGSNRKALVRYLRHVSSCRGYDFLNVYTKSLNPGSPYHVPDYIDQDIIVYKADAAGSVLLVRTDGLLDTDNDPRRDIYFVLDTKTCKPVSLIGAYGPSDLYDGSRTFDVPIIIDKIMYVVTTHRAPRLYYPGQFDYFFGLSQINFNWQGTKGWTVVQSYTVVRSF